MPLQIYQVILLIINFSLFQPSLTFNINIFLKNIEVFKAFVMYELYD